MGPYDDEEGRYLDHSDIEHAVNNGYLWEDSSNPGTYSDGEGRHYDSEYNPID